MVAAALVARQTGRRNLLSFDMGGTTAKASLIRDGQYETTPEYEVGGGASGNRWMHGTGHPIRVPVIDLAEVSAGGGSIAWVDRAGALRVGPKSAGAEPGPVCYGRGGTEPTVTDCNLLLGYLDKGSLLAGDLPIDHAAAEAAVAQAAGRAARRRCAHGRGRPSSTSSINAMAEALKIVSVQRGHDPREFALAAFGGAGPLHAAALAAELGIAEVLCPPIPGAFSALGLVGTDLKRDYVRTVYTTTAAADPAAAGGSLRRAGAGGRGHARPRRRRARSGGASSARSMRATSASPMSSSIPVPPRALDTAALAEIAEAFHDRHRQTYGHDNRGEPVQLVSVRVAAIGAIPPLPIRDKTGACRHRRRSSRKRQVWFRDDRRGRRHDLRPQPHAGRARGAGPGRDRVAGVRPFLFRRAGRLG